MEAGPSLSHSWTASTFRLTLSISDLLASFREAPMFFCTECPVFPLSRTLQLPQHVGSGEDRAITDPGLLTNQTVYTVSAFHTVAFLSSDLYKVFKGAIGQASLRRCEKAQRKPEEKMQPCPDCKLNNWVLVYLRHLREVLNFLSLGTNPPWGPRSAPFVVQEAELLWADPKGLTVPSVEISADLLYRPRWCADSMALNHTAPPQDEHLPHYLRDEDPFASKLSWEADLVAGFYLTIIGKLP